MGRAGRALGTGRLACGTMKMGGTNMCCKLLVLTRVDAGWLPMPRFHRPCSHVLRAPAGRLPV